jgi:pimeloyl-ACP methyl ester carboxylesterase
MTHHPSSPIAHPPKRVGRWGLYLVAAIAVLVASGAAYQALSDSVAARKYPPVGRMVSVGDHAMHIHCTGEGSPTVLFESGLGEGALSWSAVQPEVSKFTRACSYDRAGYFWSEPSDAERTSEMIAEELMTLLQQAGEKGPYILVGHSLGGVYVRAFASRYPDQVAGMVLVDSSHEAQFLRLPPEPDTLLRASRFLAPLGVGRIIGRPIGYATPLSSDQRSAYQEMGYLAKNYATVLREKTAAAAQAVTGLKRNPMRDDLPLVVLTQGGKKMKPEIYKTWVEMQNELAALSSRGTHIFAASAGHYIQLEEPQLVVHAVSQVVSQARH